VIGGDTNEACDVIISGLALGIIKKKHIMKRSSGLKPGHILAVTGNFGLTSVGFTYFLEGIEPSKDVKRAAIDSIYTPNARVNEGIALAETEVVSGCIDSSDGLSLSLYDLSHSSGLGFIIDNPPIHPMVFKFSERNNLDPLILAFNGGEEYELVFTYPSDEKPTIKKALKSAGCELINIGFVSEKKEIVYRYDNKLIPIKMGGWNHFMKPPSK
jgi:thiamine-monophosphate kinase